MMINHWILEASYFQTMHGCRDAWMHGCMDVWMCACMHAQMHTCKIAQFKNKDVIIYLYKIYICIYIYIIHMHMYIYIYILYTSYTCKVGYASNRFVFSFHPGYPDEPLPSIVKDPNLSNVKLSWAQPPGCSSLTQFINIQLIHTNTTKTLNELIRRIYRANCLSICIWRNHESFNISIRSPSLSLSLSVKILVYIVIYKYTHTHIRATLQNVTLWPTVSRHR